RSSVDLTLRFSLLTIEAVWRTPWNIEGLIRFSAGRGWGTRGVPADHDGARTPGHRTPPDTGRDDAIGRRSPGRSSREALRRPAPDATGSGRAEPAGTERTG